MANYLSLLMMVHFDSTRHAMELLPKVVTGTKWNDESALHGNEKCRHDYHIAPSLLCHFCKFWAFIQWWYSLVNIYELSYELSWSLWNLRDYCFRTDSWTHFPVLSANILDSGTAKWSVCQTLKKMPFSFMVILKLLGH